jgi:hypothetical protein
MEKHRPSVLWLAAAIVVGIIVGIAVTAWVSSRIFRHGDIARQIADATTDVAALEHLAAHDAEGAVAILRVRLDASMIGLGANRPRLTNSQQSQVSAIEARANKFLARDGS